VAVPSQTKKPVVRPSDAGSHASVNVAAFAVVVASSENVRSGRKIELGKGRRIGLRDDAEEKI
jgi:hypothetical protein